MSNDNYNFSSEGLWLGRLSSFTRSIDSNRQLLRVILLAKGSTLLETIKVKEQAVETVNTLLEGLGLPQSKIAGMMQSDMGHRFISIDLPDLNLEEALSGIQEGVEGTAETLQNIDPANPKNFSDLSSQMQGNFVNQTTKALEPFDPAKYLEASFEEKQLLNLYRLSLSQRLFVEKSLKNFVTSSLNKDKPNGVGKVRKGFEKIAKDIEIVQRTIVQRVHELEGGRYKQSQQAEALEMADKLAIMALRPFQHLLPSNSEVTPITFFSQETHVRTVPYCDDVVLIGIRYDQMVQNKPDAPPPFELMTIPHEIGHYVYQIADIESHATMQVLPQKSQKYWRWYEEIFSDICGCVVAGPLVSLSLLSILSSRADAHNYDEHGDHPTGVLRPFLLSKIFDILNDKPNYDFAKASEGLKKYWQTFLGDKFKKNVQEISGPNGSIQIQQTMDELEPLIRTFIEILLPQPSEPNAGIKPWSSKNDQRLQAYVDELTTIETFIAFKVIEPTQLQFTNSVVDSENNQLNLLDEWKKKGPVTIGGHD